MQSAPGVGEAAWDSPRQRVRVALVTLALGVAACSNGASDNSSAVTSASAPMPTSSSVPQTPPTEREGVCRHRPAGSSLATFDSSQGTYAAHVAMFDVETLLLSFDVVQWLSGEAAAEAYHRDHPDDPEGPPNDYYVVNESNRLRSSPVAEDATVFLVRLSADSNADVSPGTLDELASHLTDGDPDGVYWLTFDSDGIVEVCEQYRP
jgi:hypothetical protein